MGADYSAIVSLNKTDNTLEFEVDNSILNPGDRVRMKIAASNFAVGSALYTAADGKTLTTTAPSDRSYKDNITDFDPDVSRIYELQVKSFTWKSTGEADCGFLAEDIELTVPGLFRKDKKVTGWRADRFPLYLFQALKALKIGWMSLNRKRARTVTYEMHGAGQFGRLL